MSILAPLSNRSPCRPLQMTLALHTDYLFVPVTMTLEQTCRCVVRGSTGRPTTSQKETLRMYVWMCVEYTEFSSATSSGFGPRAPFFQLARLSIEHNSSVCVCAC